MTTSRRQVDAGFGLPLKGADTTTWSTYRRPMADTCRPVDETALPELVALAREIKAKGLDGDKALKEMARMAGLQQLRQASRERLGTAWGECDE